MTAQLGENSVRTYHLASDGFAVAQRKLLVQRIVIFVGVLVILFAVQYKEFGESWKGGSIASILAPILGMFLVFSAMAFGTVRGLKRSQESWSSYELTIGSNFLTRRIKNFPELEIQQHEITAIKENADGLRVETAKEGRAIGISVALVGYPDARERLTRWMPVQELRGWRTSARWTYIPSVAFTLLLVCFYMASRSWTIIATGAPLFVGLAWCLWYLRKSLYVSAYVKRLSLFSILPLLAILIRVILAIAEWH